MHVAIAIITKDRPEVFMHSYNCHKMFKPSPLRGPSNYSNQHTVSRIIIDDQSEIPIIIDGEKCFRTPSWLGVANTRNYALMQMERSLPDIFILMDDDVFPKHPYWVDAFIDMHQSFPDQHIFSAIPSKLWECDLTHKGIQIDSASKSKYDDTLTTPGRFNSGAASLVSTRAGIGAFFSITKHALLQIGGFNSFGGKYGFEDADFMNRAKKANLLQYGKGCTYPGIDQILHVADVHGDHRLHDHSIKWQSKSSLHDTKEQLIEDVKPAFIAAQESPNLYQEFRLWD